MGLWRSARGLLSVRGGSWPTGGGGICRVKMAVICVDELPMLFPGNGARTLLQSEKNDPQHFIPGGGLAGPDFELAGGLVDEHFHARDDLRAALFGPLQPPGFTWVVHHVQHIPRIDLFFLERSLLRISHAHGSSVDDHIER